MACCVGARLSSLRFFGSGISVPTVLRNTRSCVLPSQVTIARSHTGIGTRTRGFCSALRVESAIDDEGAETPKGTGNRGFPLLSPKEKKELRGYAHSLGKNIVVQQVGKAGVTESLAKAISDALEAKEILKLKVLDNSPDEIEEVIRKIEEATECQVVGKIGSVLTLYRPSRRKLSLEKQARIRIQSGR